MKKYIFKSYLLFFLAFPFAFVDCQQKQVESQTEVTEDIPLPEHPRPDWHREDWANLNGTWSFEFDSLAEGESKGWERGDKSFSKTINVPFPWGAKLSGVENEAHIAWYEKIVSVPKGWEGKKIFVIIGASDWLTTVWLDGNKVGEYQGGYTPSEFDLSDYVNFGEEQKLVIKVDDTPHDFKLHGKQGYGDAKGIWQTVYLEARAPAFYEYIHFTPDIDNEQVHVEAEINQSAQMPLEIVLNLKTPEKDVTVNQTIPSGQIKVNFTVKIPSSRLWTLDDPYLYDVKATLTDQEGNEDEVNTYFGMRKISVVNLPGTDIPYIALNNKPVYLQLALDQSYHPEGFYTFPTDQFMKEEILRSKEIGLNGQRIHIKIEHPRKLYWADRLGVLIMADLPNSWGEPGPQMRKESEFALREMIKRDYNHPSIFSWVVFNETWGLFSQAEDGKKVYKKETQDWVRETYHLTKSLDPTRLVEDNSPCNYDHVDTDINSWHVYLPGYRWKEFMDDVSKNTFPGSEWNFIGGNKQRNQPMINSECGNVWGYEGSTGDVDWSWDYHIMMNEFRSHPKMAGWLYTEHHDVVNEWNGYYKFDRSLKFTGLDSIIPGMTLNDLHSPVYVAPQLYLYEKVKPGQEIEIPLWLSVMTGEYKNAPAVIETETILFDELGTRRSIGKKASSKISLTAWKSGDIKPIETKMPDEEGLVIFTFRVKDASGKILHNNFTTFIVDDGKSLRDEKKTIDRQTVRVLRVAPDDYSRAEWTEKQWEVLNGLKVNGAGSGFFEYTVPFPNDLDLENLKKATFRLEASAKKLLGKDRETDQVEEGDYMRGEGLHDSAKNPNAYPMTDEEVFPTKVFVLVDGQEIGVATLKDDPADHRGILSWAAQPRDKTLHEAGSYGYLINMEIPKKILSEAAGKGNLIVQLRVDKESPGGLAIYGKKFGRYPIDPMVVFEY